MSFQKQQQRSEVLLGLMTAEEIELVEQSVIGAETYRDNQFQAGHPKTYRGTVAWAERTRLLRLLLAGSGRWEEYCDRNLEGVQTTDGRVILLTCVGDSKTGIPGGDGPGTRRRGALTERQVDWNALRFGRQQAALFPVQLETDGDELPITVVLFVHRKRRRVTAELSIPVTMKANGGFEFAHRELLPAIDLTQSDYQPDEDGGPDTIDFDIE